MKLIYPLEFKIPQGLEIKVPSHIIKHPEWLGLSRFTKALEFTGTIKIIHLEDGTSSLYTYRKGILIS